MRVRVKAGVRMLSRYAGYIRASHVNLAPSIERSEVSVMSVEKRVIGDRHRREETPERRQHAEAVQWSGNKRR
jgi:hypothetical protein